MRAHGGVAIVPAVPLFALAIVGCDTTPFPNHAALRANRGGTTLVPPAGLAVAMLQLGGAAIAVHAPWHTRGQWRRALGDTAEFTNSTQ